MTAAALTIAGSDPSGGAGLQADLKMFHVCGVYGMSAVTLLTVQNTQGVQAVEMVPAALIAQQVEAVLHDIPPQAIKTGALGSRENIEKVAGLASRFECPFVVDPVMISKHGHSLLDESAVDALKMELFDQATLITPNLHEAAALTGLQVNTRNALQDAAFALAALGPEHVLIKASQLEGGGCDLLYSDGQLHWFDSPRIETTNLHGTGCVYSAAITAFLARGSSVLEAVEQAKPLITRAIQSAPGLGQGFGPVNMMGV